MGKDYLGHSLSELLIEFIKVYNLDLKFFDLIMPMPLHKRKLREREFNQAQILSEFVASEFGMELSKNHLMRIRDTLTQTDLTDKERWGNVKDAFIVMQKEGLRGKKILLIDDVLSTGATCSEASGVLKQAGCDRVFVLTLAN
jgi:ComF family protein